MEVRRFYRRRKPEIKLVTALTGVVIASVFISDMLTRGLTGSPLKLTVYRLVEPFGLDAASIGALVFGVYIAALALLAIDHTKRPQSIFLILATLIGLLAMAASGQFLPSFGVGDAALVLLGIGLGVLYIGPEKLTNIVISDPGDRHTRALDAKTGGPLEFRSAERLLYTLLGAVVVFAFFEAHTDYATLVGRDLMPNWLFFTTFELTGTEGEQLAVDLAASGLFLVMLYIFLGYDAEKSYFLVGPKRSGKTHAAIALLQEAQNEGYKPRNTAPTLMNLQNKLVESDDWAPPTDDETQDLSFSFTSKGFFKKNIRLEARDYPGEYVRRIMPGIRYLNTPAEELIDGEPGIHSSKEWLDKRIRETQRAETARHGEPSQVTDGGVRDQSTSSSTSGPEGQQSTDTTSSDEAFARTDEPESDATDEDADKGDDEETQQSSNRVSGGLSREAHILLEDILPAFQRADTLLIVVDMAKFLREEPMDADVLFDIYDKSNKEAIVLVTKADLIADEFADDNGWSTAWTDEAYDEFRTHVQDRLWAHNTLRMLLEGVERPYPVGYQTTPPEGADVEDEYDREIDRSTGLGQQTIEVLGYEYVLKRIE